MKKYANIIFLHSVDSHINEVAQEGEKCPIVKVWDRLAGFSAKSDEKKLLNYLKKWDNGTDSEYDLRDKPSAGNSDTAREFGDYVLTYNTRMDYAGLERIVEVEE